MKNAALAVVLMASLAPAALAALAPMYEEWRKGPAQWIFTNDEEKAWRSVKTNEDAIRFIDLFWVRRDPTPGTPANEYRAEYEARVKHADRSFAERGKRGAMTDRGRAWVVLGPPTTSGADLKHTSQGLGGDGSRMRGSRDTWVWEHKDAQKFGMPKVELVFVEDPGTGRVSRDLHRPDFGPASAGAIRNSIVSPDLTELPNWAPHGGLEPKITITQATVIQKQVTPPPAPPAPVAQQPVSIPVPKPHAADDVPTGPFLPRGVSRLTLLRNVYEIDTEIDSDPFKTIKAVSAFKASDELGWATQYCAGSDDEPSLN
ncbi:MAG: GWxTD domain-containing protein, partial [Thermoanaerobaculia bacterium]